MKYVTLERFEAERKAHLLLQAEYLKLKLKLDWITEIVNDQSN